MEIKVYIIRVKKDSRYSAYDSFEVSKCSLIFVMFLSCYLFISYNFVHTFIIYFYHRCAYNVII